MATDSRTSTTGNLSTDAAFRAWAKGISDSLRAGGCTATSDTGMIDLATAVRPAANSMAGYEIYKLSTDTQDSTLGLRFKIEYGVGSTTSCPSLAITVGTGSNGSGTINGTVGTRREFGLSTSGVSAGTNYTCGGDGRLIFAVQWSAGASSTSAAPWLFIIERLRDNSGAVTGNGIYTLLTGQQVSGVTNLGCFAFAEIIRSGSTSTGITAQKFGAWVNNASGNLLTDYYMATHHPADRHTLYNPILSNLFHYHSDLTTGVDVSVTRYGTTRNYKPIGQLPTSSSSWPYTNFQHANAGIAILWE